MDYTDKRIRVIYGDVTLGAAGEDFHYIFSYQTGGPESLVIGGREWLYRTPKPTFWRAATDNDKGNQFPLKSGMWMGADVFIKCTGVKIRADGKEVTTFLAPSNNCHSNHEYVQSLEIAFTYETITVPAAAVEVTYEVNGSGRILVHAWYRGQQGLPELPGFGIRFIMPDKACGYEYCGLSGETYPDRKAGAVRGTYCVEGLPVTPYLVPQECGMHVETEWVTVYRQAAVDAAGEQPETAELTISMAGEPFGFSCLPYTALELENAAHQEDLPPARRTVLCIMGAVRGVGGIDSWGADVEEAYHISGEKDIEMSFVINGVK